MTITTTSAAGIRHWRADGRATPAAGAAVRFTVMSRIPGASQRGWSEFVAESAAGFVVLVHASTRRPSIGTQLVVRALVDETRQTATDTVRERTTRIVQLRAALAAYLADPANPEQVPDDSREAAQLAEIERLEALALAEADNQASHV